jgi:two-component system C4-dicarboxylate transport sensor histidine kinase DctB
VRGLDGDGADLAVWADELKLEQVLLNLVGNALDAIAAEGRTDGQIDVTVAASDETVDRGARQWPGIAPDACRACSNRSSRPRRSARAGPGLAISSSIVREFGGQLTAGNVDGGGAEFVVTCGARARRLRRRARRRIRRDRRTGQGNDCDA